jgi:multidrug efflux pump subunit AcrB
MGRRVAYHPGGILRDLGLAISLMFGEIVSLLISRMAVPVLYYMVQKKPTGNTDMA